MVRLALGLVAVALLLVPAAGAQQRLVVVIDPGHDLRANTETEPIGPGSSMRKIKDGGGTSGVVSGLREAELNLKVGLRLRSLLERSGVTVVMTRTRTAGTSMGNIARARIANRAGAALFLRIHADGSTDPSGAGHAHAAIRRSAKAGRTTSTRRASAQLVPCRRAFALPSASRIVASRSAPTSRASTGRRARDPRRDGVHDEPDRGSPARDGGVSAPRRARPLPWDAPVPRPLADGLQLSSAPVDRDDLDGLLDTLQGLGPRLGRAERGSHAVERP